MQPNGIDPQRKQNRVARMLWGGLPLVLLIGCIILIVILFMTIQTKQRYLAEEQARAIGNKRPPVNVVVLETKAKIIRDRLNLPGMIEPWTDLELLSKISGVVVKVPVTEGQQVLRGDVLAVIDRSDYKIALDAAQAAYNLAAADFKRARLLTSRGLLPEADLEKIETQVQTSKAAMDNAELQLSRCTITAPISGVIRSLAAKKGLLLSVADPVARILQIDRVKAVVGIPESDVDAVRGIDNVALTIEALNNRAIQGTKHFFSFSPENDAMLYRLELAIDNQDGDILPGMFVRADIVKKSVAHGIAVPLYSVISRNNDQFVFLEQDGIARRRPVKLGILENWMIQVTEGLQAGSRVIIEGHRSVEEGQSVNVVKRISDLEGLLL